MTYVYIDIYTLQPCIIHEVVFSIHPDLFFQKNNNTVLIPALVM